METELYWLSEFPDFEVVVICPDKACGLNWRCTTKKLVAARGDWQLRGLKVAMARAVGCKHVDGKERCWARVQVERPQSRRARVPVTLSGRQHLRSVEGEKLASVMEWHMLIAVCKCGHYHTVDSQMLKRRYSPDTEMDELAKRLRCRACRKKGESVFAVAKTPR